MARITAPITSSPLCDVLCGKKMLLIRY